MAYWHHDDIDFNYRESGQGTVFVFQHGLGGDVNQPFSLYTPPFGIRMVALDCRGHGETRPIGDPQSLGFTSFVADLVAFCDAQQIRQAVVGGISMGAGVALRFALAYPERLLGLVLVRPAWLAEPMPDNVARYEQIARLIRRHGAAEGLERFRRMKEYEELAREAPDAAASLLGQFQSPRAEDAVERLERIPRDVPSDHSAAWGTITAPTAVLANRQDPIHPFAYGLALAEAIPCATFYEVTSKSVDRRQHTHDVQHVLDGFLQRAIGAQGA